MIVES
jgi:hypothetical protein